MEINREGKGMKICFRHLTGTLFNGSKRLMGITGLLKVGDRRALVVTRTPMQFHSWEIAGANCTDLEIAPEVLTEYYRSAVLLTLEGTVSWNGNLATCQGQCLIDSLGRLTDARLNLRLLGNGPLAWRITTPQFKRAYREMEETAGWKLTAKT